MRRILLKCSLVAFLFALSSQGYSQAQRETPLEVGPLGGVPGPVRPIKPPPAIASLLPHDAQVRVVEHTRMRSSGEITVLYDLLEHPKDDPEEKEQNTHIVVVDAGKIAKDFGTLDEDCDLGGFERLRLHDDAYGAIVAFRCAGDRAQSEFFLLHSDGTGYVAESIADTGTGRIEILETNPAEIRIWSADVDHDTCIWCEQHYSVYVYAWEGAKFVLKSKKVTSKKYLPIERTQHPIVRAATPPSSRS